MEIKTVVDKELEDGNSKSILFKRLKSNKTVVALKYWDEGTNSSRDISKCKISDIKDDCLIVYHIKNANSIKVKIPFNNILAIEELVSGTFFSRTVT
jgi:hypothetical protein